MKLLDPDDAVCDLQICHYDPEITDRCWMNNHNEIAESADATFDLQAHHHSPEEMDHYPSSNRNEIAELASLGLPRKIL